MKDRKFLVPLAAVVAALTAGTHSESTAARSSENPSAKDDAASLADKLPKLDRLQKGDLQFLTEKDGDIFSFVLRPTEALGQFAQYHQSHYSHSSHRSHSSHYSSRY